MTDAKAMAKRAETLESDISTMAASIQSAEAAVADAYAEGLDASKALDKLARLRDSHKGMIAALDALDAKVYAAQIAEYEAATADVRTSMEKGFHEAERAVASSFKPVEVVLKKYSPSIAATISEVIDGINSALWADVFVPEWDRLQKAIGPRPAARPMRPSPVIAEIEAQRVRHSQELIY